MGLDNIQWGCCLKFELSGLGGLFGGAGGAFLGAPGPPKIFNFHMFSLIVVDFLKKHKLFLNFSKIHLNFHKFSMKILKCP